MSVFEQNLACKLWSSQATQALARPVSQSLIRDHIRHANVALLFNLADIVQQLEDKQGQTIPDMTD